MQDVYFVIHRTGSAWVPGKGSKEQPGYQDHADYLNAMDDKNHIVMGGPLADYSQIPVAIEANSEDEVRALFADDPWIRQDIIRVESVTKWILLVDPRDA